MLGDREEWARRVECIRESWKEKSLRKAEKGDMGKYSWWWDHVAAGGNGEV